ncbi:MAG TPA: chemotaxis protein, partial [Achromobacter sp.]|nr:chemotaxis protein [Achromobacter sp.]
WNLLNNGIKFTPPGGTVTLKLDVEDERLRLDVIDNGQGIDAQFLGKVFDMFSQADLRQRNLASPGLGIGLAVASELVKAHGGTIQAHSDGNGRGARFTVRMALANTQQQEVQLPLPGESPLKGLKVLIVDDSEDILHIMRELLEMEEACVTAVGSGREALEAFANAPFDLLLSDIGMADMDGYELIRAIREKHPDSAVPAIALTGFGSKEDMNEALQAGYSAHISKPVSLDNLLDIVRHLRDGG